jgi:hypothetical protein
VIGRFVPEEGGDRVCCVGRAGEFQTADLQEGRRGGNVRQSSGDGDAAATGGESGSAGPVSERDTTGAAVGDGVAVTAAAASG